MFESDIKLCLENISLKPLRESDREQLTALASEQRIWEYSPKTIDSALVFESKWFDKATVQMHAKKRLAFTVFMNDQMAGSSSYYEIDYDNKKLNIGYTWFHPSFWGSKINVVTKLLMMEYAIETLNFKRIGFSIDSTNERAWHALEKMHITYEGTLRNYLILENGRVRHSAIFSVVAEEWSRVKEVLHALICEH